MPVGIVNIVGEIGVNCLYEDVVAQVNRQKDSETLIFLFASIGGFVDEGDKIKDFILGLKQHTIGKNIGDVCSIASSIYLATDKRVWKKGVGTFLIHNPWVGALEGDADFLKEASEDLKSIEAGIEKYLSKRTGLNSETISNLMAKNEPMNEETLIDLGFVHEFVQSEPQLKAVAKLKTDKMSTEAQKKLDESVSALDKVFAKFKSLLPKAKALMLQDSSGMELDFYELEEGATPSVGDKANADGKPAEGSYVMIDGSTYNFTAGELTEIIPAEVEDVEALKAKITELEGQLAEKDSSMQAKETELTEQAEAFKAQADEMATTIADVKSRIKSMATDTGNDLPKGEDTEEKPVRRSRKQKE